MNNTHEVVTQFGFAGGSVIGSDHALVGRPGAKNNQDAYHWAYGRNCSFAVICDGCSSGKHSEVGAHLVARILSHTAISIADEVLDENPEAVLLSDFWQQVELSLIDDIKGITAKMGKSVSQTINDFWLCTIVGTLITPLSTYIVAVGDGSYAVNGQIYHLKPGEGNSPTYLAYQISGTTLTLTDPNSLHLRVHNAFDTQSVQSILLASDGIDYLIKSANANLPGKAERIGGYEQFMDEKHFLNPDNVRRRLALIGLETIRDGVIASSTLKDDTTIVTIRRHPNATPPSQPQT